MENQLAKSIEERTFQYQDSLPPLPVPSLEESLKKYLESVKPFANEDEYKKTEEIVQKFQDGVGKTLHQKLLERAKGKRNWLEEWWLNVAYLDVRIPSQLNVNFVGPSPHFEHYWPAREGTQLERGSILLWHNLNYWQLLRREKLPVHKSGNTPLDMNQFRMLFSTCKVPGITRDSIMNYFKTESEGHCPTHIAVLCRGRAFVFDVLHDGCLITPPELLRQLTYIYQKCWNEPVGPSIAALTSEERTRWAKAREYLIGLDPENLTLLEKIQSSLFVYSIEDTSPHATPENFSQVFEMLLGGDPAVRWGDKSYNLISFANGIFGCSCDHAPYDAMVMVNIAHYVDEKLLETEGRWKGSEKVRDIPLPEELAFTVDEKILNDVYQAKAQHLKAASDLQIAASTFTSFGKKLTKKEALHPDTFIQLALQLAYYRLHGRPGCCYETAMTRYFYHGRTETVRSCTVEAVRWCQSMQDPSASLLERQQKMLDAFAKHNKMMRDCSHGKGFDRHLLGLLLIAKEEGLPVPELFEDPLFSRSGGGGNFVLSTSLVGYLRIQGVVVPMVHNGYGFFYHIRDDRFVVTCSSWRSCLETDAEKLVEMIFHAFHDMIHLMNTAHL
ncbi:carnitine O-octanoyltransferase, isoform CRA_a [Rattus norvegicus]|nr:peroxisomal carnitine O-octanoyltransferase [Rattus norvegicus]XP_006236067.1 peroxisomal carnitine O-octanoyltransferase isoform X4 [Rattus norvegicus]XP_038964386.1 peroxisomal carnitine O-octanoyltransferase isoform X4 [Rattus norvegicus]XP_038964387.1 peroxisomal carnitine O-octanoyltransferase isoform X4 [Rattus norvegicus]XP_038964388.1 peroxisomal carnitine O-octanoyltransferase isoform X4 [Rattus norvegicus]AAH74004.1 Carnitine O-octanoyltransferase [Rattus norvegicus]EDL84313.1 ca|eukprot:XP_006236067.1 PREDICTED: peroxisomal carnitine O-octanoyltransferase isoform X2 [Rattus norvegicus]